MDQETADTLERIATALEQHNVHMKYLVGVVHMVIEEMNKAEDVEPDAMSKVFSNLFSEEPTP